MKSDEFMNRAKQEVVNYYSTPDDSTDKVNVQITTDDVYFVWFNYTLQRMKALLSTTVPDGMYFEITYNPISEDIYFDAYKKVRNKCISAKTR